MKLLLGSGGFRTPERIETLRAALRERFGDRKRLLFIPYALADHDGYVRSLTERGLNADYELVGVHTSDDPVSAVKEADGFYVGGGNTFRLVKTLQDLGLLSTIRERVAAGVPYFGVSAGSNVVCPTMMTTNDMPIVQPKSFEALGLVPFQINAHYYEGSNYVRHGDEYAQHFGETRDDRIREFHEENETPVLGLWEGGLLHRDGDRLTLSATGARLFRRGEEPVDYEPGTDLSFLL